MYSLGDADRLKASPAQSVPLSENAKEVPESREQTGEQPAETGTSPSLKEGVEQSSDKQDEEFMDQCPVAK